MSRVINYTVKAPQRGWGSHAFGSYEVKNKDKSAESMLSSHRHPFFFEVLLGDGEWLCKAVFWNTLVPAYFSRIHIGDVLSLSGFKLKMQVHEPRCFGRPCCLCS